MPMAADRYMRARYEGCLVGHAVGDALGAPVEFASRSEIHRLHGSDGVTDFLPWTTESGVAMAKGFFTDDTQMMLATAEACLLSGLESFGGVRDLAEDAYGTYRGWLATQDDPTQRRGPGETCLSALRSGRAGSVDDPLNSSKGAGGIMRVAPVALAFGPGRAFERGVELAAITHGHPSGYLAAGFYADVLSRVARGARLSLAIADSREEILGWEDADEVIAAVDLAVELRMSEASADESLGALGQGWVADEALGIALFCALAYREDWAEGVLCAVNIDGDSDTTGALTGGLLGALLGIDSIPGDWVREVEDSAKIRQTADRLYGAFAEVG